MRILYAFLRTQSHLLHILLPGARATAAGSGDSVVGLDVLWWRATGRSRKTTPTRRMSKLCILLHFCVFLRISAQPRRTSLWCDVMGCVRNGHFSALDAHSCAFYAHSLRIQSKCTPIAFDAALPKCKPRCRHPGSPGCIKRAF